jgi:hypothetical protein
MLPYITTKLMDMGSWYIFTKAKKPPTISSGTLTWDVQAMSCKIHPIAEYGFLLEKDDG